MMYVLSPDHADRWEVPDWLDPRGHYVYIAWSERDPSEVLYVGMTSRLFARLAAHAADSDWWGLADHIDTLRWSTRALAAVHEARLINELDPEYNVIHPYVRAREEALDAIP